MLGRLIGFIVCFGFIAILGLFCTLYIMLPGAQVPTYGEIRRQSKKYMKKYPKAKKKELLAALKSHLVRQALDDNHEGGGGINVVQWVREQRRLKARSKTESRIEEVVEELFDG